MTFYIDAVRDSKTGWLGYDPLISPATGAVKRSVGANHEWEAAEKAEVAVGDDGMELSIPRPLLPGDSLDFKWADHCREKGDWTDFTLNGEAAPNERFRYRAILK